MKSKQIQREQKRERERVNDEDLVLVRTWRSMCRRAASIASHAAVEKKERERERVRQQKERQRKKKEETLSAEQRHQTSADIFTRRLRVAKALR